IDIAIGPEAIDAASRILQACLALIGEIQVAIAGESQIIGALQALAAYPGYDRLNGARPWIERQDPLQMVGNEDAPVLVDGKSVGPAIILCRNLELSRRRDAQDASIGNIDDI